MPYDLFISYSQRDNAQGRITELVSRINADFALFAKRELVMFFDQQEIHGMSDWRQRILQGLRESRLLLGCLSPAYLQSEYCQWEFVEYLKYEIGHLHGFNGVAPIYFVEVPSWENKEFQQQCAAWVAELRKRQHFDLRPWHDQGADALRETAVQEIAGMDDWPQKIQRSSRDSQVFLAVLSPQYLASPYCRWEWEDYVRYDAMRQCLGEGVAPVFFVTQPDAADPKTDQALAGWIDEIQRRQTFDLRPWHDAGEQALQQAHVRQTLEQLHASVRERLNRAERSRSSPNNLIKHNPAFVGCVARADQVTQCADKKQTRHRRCVNPVNPETPPRDGTRLVGMGEAVRASRTQWCLLACSIQMSYPNLLKPRSSLNALNYRCPSHMSPQRNST